MFGFGKTVKDPLADAKSAERWFAAQPAGDPLAIHAELMSALGAIAERGRERTPAALEAVFRADALAQPVREALTAQYIEHATRSSRIEHQLWSAMFDLSQAFLLAYAAFSHDVSDHAQSNKWQALLPELSRARSSTSGSTRRSGSTATSSGSRPNGPSCTRCSRSPARTDRAPADRRRTAARRPRRSSTPTWSCWCCSS